VERRKKAMDEKGWADGGRQEVSLHELRGLCSWTVAASCRDAWRKDKKKNLGERILDQGNQRGERSALVCQKLMVPETDNRPRCGKGGKLEKNVEPS